jgi:hypothetical protein
VFTTSSARIFPCVCIPNWPSQHHTLQPSEIFFYLFLPPLLLDSAVRIDYYVFRKVLGIRVYLCVTASAAQLCTFLCTTLQSERASLPYCYSCTLNITRQSKHASFFNATAAPCT